MNPHELALWQRIETHAFDDGVSACPLSLRLAKENGWGPCHTARVMAEYRRFAFLAVAAGHPVSPSDAVDQAWHLHLLYTRDYWEVFCAQVLQTPLHHGPTRGGTQEAEKFTDWYARTLASYRRFFGDPPADIWPEPATHPATVRVDVARHWIIRKPAWLLAVRAILRRAPAARAAEPETPTQSPPLRSSAATPIVAMLALFALPNPAQASPGDYSPFELSGPQFLWFFVFLALGLGIAAWLLRRRLRGPHELAAATDLDPYEIAFLGGGRRGAFLAALLNLGAQKKIRAEKSVLHRGEIPSDATNKNVLERAILRALPASGGAKLGDVRRACEDALDSLERGLVERGLFLDEGSRLLARFVPGLVLALLPLTGLIKMIIGLNRGRPVDILIVFTLAATGATLYFTFKRLGRTVRAEKLLAQLREQHAAWSAVRPQMLAANDSAALLIPIAIGLFGVTALQATPLDEMAKNLGPLGTRTPGGDGGGCGSSCGSSDSGGSSCGGGDGGGGGCGGCGGGGGD